MERLTYFWSCEVVIPGQGLHDARGAHLAPAGISETDLKAAIARDTAEQHRVPDPSSVIVLSLTYSAG